MFKAISRYSDVGSLILAVGILGFFLGRPGYQPSGENGLLLGIGVVLVIAAVYAALEASMVLADRTPSPLYVALETLVSHLPGYALLWVLAAVYYGATTLSNFQWITFAIFTAVVLFDLIGIVTIVARQLLLTDELKSVK